MSFQIANNQQIPLSVAFTDAGGNPATLSGAPAWASSDDTVLTVKPAADGLSAVASATGKVGTATIAASVDGATATIGASVTGGAAAAGSIIAGAPVVIPVAVVAAPVVPAAPVAAAA